MTDRPSGQDPLRDPNDRNEAMAGSANMPPFDPNEPDEGGGRPPSHREFDEQGSRSGESLEGIAPASDALDRGERKLEEEAEKLGEAGERARDEASRRADSLADRIDDAADRVHDRAERHRHDEGIRGSAARWADRAADSGADAADYLRDAGVDDIRALVERQVRERPLQTLLLAAATGWIVGKILR